MIFLPGLRLDGSDGDAADGIRARSTNSEAWLTRAGAAPSTASPGALKKTIFELQARDWNRRQQNAIPDQQLVDVDAIAAAERGVKNYGYYPDDFINNQPDISQIRPAILPSCWYPNQ